MASFTNITKSPTLLAPLTESHLQDFVYNFLKNEYSTSRHQHGRKTLPVTPSDLQSMADGTMEQHGRVMLKEPIRWTNLGKALQAANGDSNGTIARLRSLEACDVLSQKARTFLEEIIVAFAQLGRFSRRRTKYAKDNAQHMVYRELLLAADLVVVLFPTTPSSDDARSPDKSRRRGFRAHTWVDMFAIRKFPGERSMLDRGMPVCERARRTIWERETNRAALTINAFMIQEPQPDNCPLCIAGVEHDEHEQALPAYHEKDASLPTYEEPPHYTV